MTTPYQPLSQNRPWDSQSELLECTMVLRDSHNVMTHCFRSASGRWFDYLPGQFITLELPLGGQTVHRTYTLSSSPSRPLCLSITTKAGGEGSITRWLHRNLKVGDKIRAYGPAGLFSFVHNPADKYLFLAGGVGITPLMSMTRYLFDTGIHTDVTFVQCAQTPSDLLFRRELEHIGARLPEFKVAYVCEKPDEYGVWTGYTGRISPLLLEVICPDYFQREIFCCGPAPFMQAVRDILHAAGYDMAHYHEEPFDTPVREEADRPAHHDVIPDASHGAVLHLARRERRLECSEGDTLLTVAKRAGVHIPSACQFGVCGTCKVKKLSGEVHMVHNGGITDEELAAGYVLACCAHPLGEVVIDY
ncbi:MAG TPA: hybrid-cluster NAD(P)-dependent oxidoreductase [Candidatus Competibacteraceae bacterium]|nr:hybrid-cluster NAD(P)-dependent oxidoreductase [Candidatus Competibacteraceae bacterium]